MRQAGWPSFVVAPENKRANSSHLGCQNTQRASCRYRTGQRIKLRCLPVVGRVKPSEIARFISRQSFRRVKLVPLAFQACLIPLLDQRQHLVPRNRSGEIVPLREGTPEALDHAKIVFRFDTFGDDFKSERV